MFGRQVDNSDAQYSQFRDNIPKILPLVTVHLLFNKANRHFSWITSQLRFSLLTSLIVLVIFHGSSSLKYLFIVSVSYSIGKGFAGTKWNPLLTWVFNVSILFANAYFNGYLFKDMFGPSFAWLDKFEGVQARWQILFNFAVLRLISFNMDYYWACNSQHPSITGESPSDRDRIATPLKHIEYNYINFLAYVLYTPLLLCGPIITYNDFISQVIHCYNNTTHVSYFTSLVSTTFKKYHQKICRSVRYSTCGRHFNHGIDTSLFICGSDQ